MAEQYPGSPIYGGQPVRSDGSIPIPTQPANMGKALESKKREEIMVLVIFMLLAVLISWGIFIAVAILRQFAEPIFDRVENAGVSVENLKSLAAFRNIRTIRIGGRVAVGVILGIALLSRGVTTLIMSILWGLANLITILASISFFRNSARRKAASPMEISALVVGAFAILTSIYMPIEIANSFLSTKYWIPCTTNSISLWVMIPTLAWTLFLVVYFIVAVISVATRPRNNVTNP